jgi:hypothetical protein
MDFYFFDYFGPFFTSIIIVYEDSWELLSNTSRDAISESGEAGNTSVGFSGMLYDRNSRENFHFDINDFLQLTGCPNSARCG